MKTSLIQKSLLILLVGASLASCGKKNKVNSDNNNTSNNGVFGDPQYRSNLVPRATINEITNNIQCTGGQRLQQVVNFNTRSTGNQSGSFNGTNTTIFGPYSPGSLTGNLSKIYVGKSRFGDVMIVTRVTNGAQTIGFNITLSYCSMNANNGYPLISNERRLDGFEDGCYRNSYTGQCQSQKFGITIDDDVQCGYGNVDSAQLTRVISQPPINNNQFYSTAFPVDTTFFPYCGQQF